MAAKTTPPHPCPANLEDPAKPSLEEHVPSMGLELPLLGALSPAA